MSVAELPDFAAFGATEEEAWANYRGALESHLGGYLALGTAIPLVRTLCRGEPGRGA